MSRIKRKVHLHVCLTIILRGDEGLCLSVFASVYVALINLSSCMSFFQSQRLVCYLNIARRNPVFGVTPTVSVAALRRSTAVDRASSGVSDCWDNK